jgi:hypothetical protein
MNLHIPGLTFKEGIATNGGLTALKSVTQALANKSAHVPYRNNPLTKFLRGSFGE